MILSEEISSVRAFTLSAGAAVVKWHSAYSDMLYQVYINGRWRFLDALHLINGSLGITWGT